MENKFCLIGNSHTSQFDYPKLEILYGYGASICGLYNENSVLKLKEKILNYQHLNPDKYLVFFLGQSDIEFIYYYKCIKNNNKINITEFIDEIVEKYVEFIINYIKKPIILGINPTVIKSNEHIFNVNFRDVISMNTNPSGSNHLNIKYVDVKHFYDVFEKRFCNNLDFNKKLNEECQKKNIPYIDLNKYILDEKNNVKEEYLYNHEDHHLKANIKLCNYLFNELKQIIIS